MQGGIQHTRGPEILSGIVPFARLAGDAEFHVIMRVVKRDEQSQACATGRVAVQVRRRAVGGDPDVPAQIQRPAIGGAIRRAGAVDAPNGIVDILAGIAKRHCAAQFRAHAAAGQQRINRQRVIGNLVQPTGAPFGISTQRQQDVSGANGKIVVQHIINLRKTHIEGGRVAGTIRGAILEGGVEAGLEQNIIPGAIQKDGRKIRHHKAAVLAGHLVVLKLRIAEHHEVVVDGRFIQGRPGNRLRLRRFNDLLFRVGGDLLRFRQLVLQLLELLDILFMHLFHQLVRLLQTLHLFAQLLHGGLQGIEVGIAHLGRNRPGQRQPQDAGGGQDNYPVF